MNYLALGAGIFAALLALSWTLNILRVSLGQARWGSNWSFTIHALGTGVFGTLAVWLFGMVAG